MSRAPASRVAARCAAALLGLLVAGCNPSSGASSQRFPIGNACVTSGQCGTGAYYCNLGWPGGYCTVSCRASADCPTGSLCVGATMMFSGACQVACNLTSDCRAGYQCLAPVGGGASSCAFVTSD